MAPNYPDLPDSPQPEVSNNTKIIKKSSKVPSSPLSKYEEIEIEDFDKYEVRRSADGTGIFSSLFTISMVILN